MSYRPLSGQPSGVPLCRVWRWSWRATQHKPFFFWSAMVAFMGFFMTPAATGFVVGRSFGALERGDTAQVFRLIGLLALLEGARIAFLHYGAIWFTKSWELIRGLLRANMLAAQLASGGSDAGRPVSSAGEAVTRFRDDTEDVAVFVDTWIDVAGGLMFSVVALSILAAVDPLATAVMMVPMAAVGLATNLLGPRLRAVHRDDRHATADVTGMLGDVMAAVVTVKVNQRRSAVLGRLAELMDHRRHTAVRSKLFDYAIRSFSQSTTDIGLGLVIVVAVGAVQQGRFGVAEIALFGSYGGWLGFLPRMMGLLATRRQQATVAFEEMSRLMPDGDAANTVVHRDLPIDALQPPAAPAVFRPRRVPLERLEVRGLTARFGNGGGIDDVSFTVERGSMTVVTGSIGSGKTTLLRTILGLDWQAVTGGGVWWNGELVDDRAAFFVPPLSGYLPQVPQLISDALSDNVLLGVDDGSESNGVLDRVLQQAAIDTDVARLADGVGTLIGPRGLRLSGGQRQRLAMARALVHRPELLVLDDLSSALDVETELRLWQNLAAARVTVLAVSHRRVAFDRADQVLKMDGGRLV